MKNLRLTKKIDDIDVKERKIVQKIIIEGVKSKENTKKISRSFSI